jgi:hypothetical protein
MNHVMVPRLAALMLFAALAGCSAPGSSTTMAPPPRYTASVLLRPAQHAQARTIQFRPNSAECWAIAHVQSSLKNVRCYDVLTLQLGPWHRRGQQREGYASIQQCVARLTPAQLHAGCVHSVQTCANRQNGQCAPDWTARTSIEFLTNGKRVTKEWLTCTGFGIFQDFRYHLHYCGAAKEFVPWKRGWLSVGDDYELDIPNVVQVGTEERFDLRPDGALLFTNCC